MKRLMTPALILLAAALVVVAGYFGFNSAAGNTTQTDANPSAPPTVPVTRGDVQQTVIAPGQLVGTGEMVLGLDVGGRLAEVNVRPGDVVHKGDVLARLDPQPFETTRQEARLKLARAEAEYGRELATAELAVETARLKLAEAEAEHPRQLTEAKLALQMAESQLAQARLQFPALTAAEIRLQNAIETAAEAEVEYQEALERRRANWEPEEIAQGYLRALEAARDARAIAQAEYESARGSQAATSEGLKSLEAEIERAKIALERLEAGVDPLLALALEQARKSLTDLQEAGVDPLLELAVEKAQADLEAATLVAPLDGVVLEVRARPAETVAQGAELIALTDPAAVEARTTVIEEDLSLVQVGQPTELFFDARPEAAVGGKVTRIVPQRVAGEARPLYHVYVALEKSPEGLLPGMTVDASIVIAQRTDALRLPRALVRAGSDETAQVEVWADGHTQKRTVQVGLRGDVYVEILDGLREGEQVVGQ